MSEYTESTDLLAATDQTNRLAAESLFAFRVADQRLADLIDLIDWDMPLGSSRDEALEITTEARHYLAELKAHLIEQVATSKALIAGMRVLLMQRNSALDSRLSEADMIDLLRDANGFAEVEARKLLTLLLSSDDDLLSSDIVLDHQLLTDVRRAFNALMSDIDNLIEA